jgi:uncharacterized surface protein with fasciclin (FAS1) repeats
MNIRTIIALFVVVVMAAAAPLAVAQDHPSKAEHPKKVEQPAKVGDIVAVAAGAGDFNTLVAAVKAAGLVETLQGKGPFTVFAPTDAAFAKLPKGTVEDLLKPANKAKLVAILTYHVVPGKIMAADVKTMKAASVEGQNLDFVVKDGKVMVNGANVVGADVAASNGVIHVIDTVLIPPTH